MAKFETLNDLSQGDRKFRGRWVCDKRHRILYVRDDNEGEEAVEIEASLIGAEPNALVAVFAEKQKNGRRVTRTARLEGSWRMNERHQLEFEVSRASGIHDVLTFKGRWKLGPSQEIVYVWRRTNLLTKTRTQEELTLRGWWDLSSDHRLTYTLQGSGEPSLLFAGTFQTRSLSAKKGQLSYQLGASVEGKKSRRVLTLFGRWKLSADLDLIFEIACSDGRLHEIRFGTEIEITPSWEAAVRLVGRQGEPLGGEIRFSREFLKNGGGGFVRLRRTLRDSAVEAGFSVPW
ncbi:MAG: hypothetical protein FGM27_04895 [Candidatus Omnitrophica bacterium]|nr:hypothetical protein [Candidatus Omnitrophota bacterium]